MNDAQRSVLQRHFRQLSNDLILTDDLLGAMYQKKIFERNMIELIKSEKTASEQVVRMLELLPKRGPDAFDSFVEIITENYPWLAAMLESSLKQESMKYNQSMRVESIKSEYMNDRADSVRFSDYFEPEPDIKTKVASFVHKQFGHSKRISENDKKAMFRWMSSQLQAERKRFSSATSRTSSVIPAPVLVDVGVNTDLIKEEKSQFDMSQIQPRIKKIYEKIQQIKTTANSKNSQLNSKSANGVVITPRTPNGAQRPSLTPASFDTVISELDTMVTRIEKLEEEVNKCHVMLNDKDKKLSLSLHIYDLSLTIKQRDKELQQEKQKCEKMLNELYEYSKKVNQLDHASNNQKSTIDNQADEIEKLKAERDKFSNQVSHFEKISMMHSEKQKTLENLKSMVRDLQNSKDVTQPSHYERTNNRMSQDSRSSLRKSNGIMGKALQTTSPTRSSISRRGVPDETPLSSSPSRRYGYNRPQQYKRKTSNSIYKV
ncbi:unnamed protein product [Mytilus edulis]|uniref:CARD domain-containing protein n=2 Tax=Mytilus edulis TaxID=6550 RepID=A0A8S3Q8P5_MYTED|nr:unnamed protein product [Mytilus edulis]